MIIFKEKTYSFLEFPETFNVNGVTVKKDKKHFIAKLLYKIPFFKRIQDKALSYTLYKNDKEIGDIELSEISKIEVNIVWLCINSDQRGQHFATMVLSYFLKIFKEKGYKEVSLEVPGKSPDARHIYEKLGFKFDGILDTPKEDPLWGGLTKMRLKL